MNRLFRYLFFFLGCVSLVALPAKAESLNSEDYAEIGEVVDGFQGVAEDVSNVSNKLHKVLADKNNDETRDFIMELLDKVGVDGGWAKQIGTIKKIKGSSEFISKALTGLSRGAKAMELIAAFNDGDKEVFKDIVADEITSLVASWLGEIVSKAIITKGQGVVVGSLAGGPIAMILAEAGVLIGGWAAGETTEWLVEMTVNETNLRDYLEQLGGAIYDGLKGDSEEEKGDAAVDDGSGSSDDGNGMMCKPGDDPFDSQPESDGGESGKKADRYQGLKEIKLF